MSHITAPSTKYDWLSLPPSLGAAARNIYNWAAFQFPIMYIGRPSVTSMIYAPHRDTHSRNMAELQSQTEMAAAASNSSSPPPPSTADRLVPEEQGRVVLDGSGYADCDGRQHVVNVGEYNVCVQMGNHGSIAQQSQGYRLNSANMGHE